MNNRDRRRLEAMKAETVPIKLCWWCRHFSYETGSKGYSERTPGSSMGMSCGKYHWCLDPYETTEEQFRAMLQMAQTCQDWALDPGKLK